MIARLLISPSIESRVGEIEKILSQHGLSINHPDLLYFDLTAKLGIEQARIIRKHFSLKPYSAKGRMVVLEDAANLTHEAQNALLKTLEELPENALFILGVDSDSKLLPTVLSRCQIVSLEGRKYNNYKNYTKNLEVLLKADIPERFEYIEKLKDRGEFLKFMIQYFHQNLASHPQGANLNFLQELLQAEEWTKQHVNIRAVLEYLMLKMPQKL